MTKMDLAAIHAWIEEQWESHALSSLADFIEIPALSPAFDDEWAANGYLDDTIDLFLGWLGTLPMKSSTHNYNRGHRRWRSSILQPPRQAATFHWMV